MQEGEQNGLTLVQTLVSRVMGELIIEVDFDEERHATIQTRFQTAEMKAADRGRFKPLELAGNGFLQVIQIFAYLVYFKPVVLLVDDHDLHLHPTAQERLVTVLAEAARRFETQAVIGRSAKRRRPATTASSSASSASRRWYPQSAISLRATSSSCALP